MDFAEWETRHPEHRAQRHAKSLAARQQAQLSLAEQGRAAAPTTQATSGAATASLSGQATELQSLSQGEAAPPGMQLSPDPIQKDDNTGATLDQQAPTAAATAAAEPHTTKHHELKPECSTEGLNADNKPLQKQAAAPLATVHLTAPKAKPDNKPLQNIAPAAHADEETKPQSGNSDNQLMELLPTPLTTALPDTKHVEVLQEVPSPVSDPKPEAKPDPAIQPNCDPLPKEHKLLADPTPQQPTACGPTASSIKEAAPPDAPDLLAMKAGPGRSV